MSTHVAPDLTPGYPSGGKKLGPAWQALWDRLQSLAGNRDPFLDGHELSADVAGDYGLASTTLIALLSRAAKANLIQKDSRAVHTGRGTRMRTFYAAPHKARETVDA